MGIKKRAAGGPAKSEDKRARLDAGLDLELNSDLSDTALEHIVKEVGAPKAKLELLDAWLSSVCTLLTSSHLPKAQTSALPQPPAPLPVCKYPGAKLLSALPLGALASRSLVFPQAQGHILLQLDFLKPPSGQEQVVTYWHSALAQLRERLAASSLVEAGSVEYQLEVHSSLPSLSFRPEGKLGRHLTVSLLLSAASLEEPSSPLHWGLAAQAELAGLQQELKTLVTSNPGYRTLIVALQIWARQVHLLLPPCLAEVLVLHLSSTGHLTSHMKAWQGLRKVWAFLASSTLQDQDLILGVGDPVPSSVAATCCPLQDRAGCLPLFPSLARTSWQLLVRLAEQAQGHTVEQALLTRSLPEAFYDRVFEVTGNGAAPPSLLVASIARGLGGRVSSLGVLGGRRRWGEGGPGGLTLELGVRLEAALYWQPSTLGPESGKEEACQEFRQFWGDRSQLRRFQDGSVKEVVVWGGDREEVVGDIVRAVLARHHGGAELEERGGWGEALLQGDGGSGARSVLDSLVPALYSLEGLSLAVAGVSATGPGGRASRVGEVRVRKPGGKTVRTDGEVCLLTGKGGMAAATLRPLEVSLRAEHSGKWPREGEAARRLRTAWLQEVGRALAKKVAGVRVRMAGERLLVLQDSVVLRFSVGEKGDTESESELTSWLSGVNKTFPAWSGAVRLSLRWAAAHLLSSVPGRAVEVSCAAVLSSAPHPPTSPTSAFLLWLSTLASHDWNSSPLTAPGCSTSQARSSLPPMAVLVPHSPSPSYWTRQVTWPELQRMVSLATCSLAKLQPSPLALFSPDLSCYEALIHLKPLQVPARHLAVTSERQQQEKRGEETDSPVATIPIVDHDPVSLYVSMLSRCYGGLAKFYYDKFGGTVVAVKLLSQAEKVKVHQLSCKMVKDEMVATNWGAVMEDWGVLGDGLVREVQVLNTDAMVS